MPLLEPADALQVQPVLARGGSLARSVAPAGPPTARTHVPLMEEGVPKMEPTAAQKTWFPKAADTAMEAKKWYVVDADGLRLGRMASEVAKILIGKHKETYTPGQDVGDAVIIINAEKVMVTGKKADDKLYRRHSGRPGGMKVETFSELQARIPERIVEKAIVGMLPKNSHGRELFRHLKVYKGPEHPHEAQTPEPLEFGGLTSTPDTRLLEFIDPDAPTCATMNN